MICSTYVVREAFFQQEFCLDELLEGPWLSQVWLQW